MNQAKKNDSKKTLWVISELYYPDTTSTGHILAGIAEGLVDRFSVHVLCGQPRYAGKGTRSPWRECRNGVDIKRCWGTTWNKDVFWKRIVNLITISISVFGNLLLHLHRNDRVLVVTNPPLLPFLVAFACWLRGAKCVLLIHDVYPEAAVAAGFLKKDHWATRLLQKAVRRLYRSVDKIAVIGRDMQTLVRTKRGYRESDVVVIPNPADLDSITPEERKTNPFLQQWGLSEKFVIQCAGNIGPLHDAALLMECAAGLKKHPNIHFVIIGSGGKKAWLERIVREKELMNVSLLPPFPREESQHILNACDVAISMLIPGMLGVSVPSRACNTFAAGKPMIIIGDRESELSRVVLENNIGWTSPPGDAAAAVETILQASSSTPEAFAAMCKRARTFAEKNYCWSRVIDAYATLLGPSLDGGALPPEYIYYTDHS